MKLYDVKYLFENNYVSNVNYCAILINTRKKLKKNIFKICHTSRTDFI